MRVAAARVVSEASPSMESKDVGQACENRCASEVDVRLYDRHVLTGHSDGAETSDCNTTCYPEASQLKLRTCKQ